jgi:hypothetical protein
MILSGMILLSFFYILVLFCHLLMALVINYIRRDIVESKMEAFRMFVNSHPLLRDEVRSGKSTWQNIYEEWVLYGENNPEWNKYVAQDTAKDKPTSFNFDSVKNIVGYIQKINPDSLNRTLNSVQKIIQIVQTVGGTKGAKGMGTPMGSSMYSDWWD